MLELSESWDTCLEELLARSGPIQEKEMCGSQSIQLNRVRVLKCILMSDTEMQRLEFAKLGFNLIFVQYLLAMLHSLHFIHFEMVIYILYHYMLEAWYLVVVVVFFFTVKRITVNRLCESQKRFCSQIGALSSCHQ